MNINATPYRVFTSATVTFSLIFLCPFAARADTSAQTQKAIQAVCSHAAASYGKRDLSGFITIYAPDFTVRSVSGRKSNFRQNIAGIANSFAKDNIRANAVCAVSQVIPQGNQARAVLHWHYISVHSAPAYTLIRDYQEQSLWKKTASGWQETSGDMVSDALQYRR